MSGPLVYIKSGLNIDWSKGSKHDDNFLYRYRQSNSGSPASWDLVAHANVGSQSRLCVL